jgi:hypothetical protein
MRERRILLYKVPRSPKCRDCFVLVCAWINGDRDNLLEAISIFRHFLSRLQVARSPRRQPTNSRRSRRACKAAARRKRSPILDGLNSGTQYDAHVTTWRRSKWLRDIRRKAECEQAMELADKASEYFPLPADPERPNAADEATAWRWIESCSVFIECIQHQEMRADDRRPTDAAYAFLSTAGGVS